MAILVIQDQVEVRERVAFAIEGTFGGEVYQAATPAEGLAFLQKPTHSAVTLVVLDLSHKGGSDLEALQNFDPKLPCVLCLDLSAANPHKIKWEIVAKVDRGQLLKNLLLALNVLAKKNPTLLGFHEDDFCKIKTKLLLSVCPLKGDIYIRLSEVKFVKLFHEGDEFEATDLEKYTVKKGVEYLYLRKSDVPEFISKYSADLQKLARVVSGLSIQDLGKAHGSIYETTAELVRAVGFTQEVQQLTKTHVAMTVKSMDKSMRLGNILDRVKAYGGLYLGAHSGIVSYIACAIATQMDWASESTFHKLTLAAFLHDITLSNHELAACTTLQEVAAGNFTEREVAEYKVHPIKAAEIARQFQEIPPDVDVIIGQHHERPDGSGFPRGIAYSYIAPLAIVFIVAHDMAQYFLKAGSQMDRDAFLAEAKEKYTSSQFRKVLDAIEKL